MAAPEDTGVHSPRLPDTADVVELEDELVVDTTVAVLLLVVEVL